MDLKRTSNFEKRLQRMQQLEQLYKPRVKFTEKGIIVENSMGVRNRINKLRKEESICICLF